MRYVIDGSQSKGTILEIINRLKAKDNGNEIIVLSKNIKSLEDIQSEIVYHFGESFLENGIVNLMYKKEYKHKKDDVKL